jgi:hypothetical protein
MKKRNKDGKGAQKHTNGVIADRELLNVVKKKDVQPCRVTRLFCEKNHPVMLPNPFLYLKNSSLFLCKIVKKILLYFSKICSK